MILNNVIPGSLGDIPSMDHKLVEILFLFGLEDAEFTQLFAQFNAQSLEKLCAQFKDTQTDGKYEEEKILGVKEDPTGMALPAPSVTPRRSKRNYTPAKDDDNDEQETVQYFQNGRPKKPKKTRRKHFNYIPMMVEALEKMPGKKATAAKVIEYVLSVCPEVQSRQGWQKTVKSYLGQDNHFKRIGVNSAKEVIYRLALPSNWPCVFCSIAPFSSQQDLHQHQDEIHDGFKEKCDENDHCQMMFRSSAELEVHMNGAHKTKPEIPVPDRVAQFLRLDTGDPDFIIEDAQKGPNMFQCLQCSSMGMMTHFSKAVEYR